VSDSKPLTRQDIIRTRDVVTIAEAAAYLGVSHQPRAATKNLGNIGEEHMLREGVYQSNCQ
jgi:hypothetical protein